MLVIDYGRGRRLWMGARSLAPLLDRLTSGLQPYPASASRRPSAPTPPRELVLAAAICGPARCRTATRASELGGLVTTGGPIAAPKPAPFYVVRLCYVRRAAPAVNVLGRRLWSYLYVPSARATRGNPFGERSSAWSSVRFPAPLLDRLTNGLEPYPTSPSWRPTAPGAGGRFPMRWVAIGALAVIAALALRRRSRAGAARPVA